MKRSIPQPGDMSVLTVATTLKDKTNDGEDETQVQNAVP
jgi:hypothetical protein